MKFQFFKLHIFTSYSYGSIAPDKLLSAIQSSRLQILTPEIFWVKDKYTGPDYFKEACKVIQASNIRPVVIFLTNNDARDFLLACYDLGLRKQDAIFISITSDLSTLTSGMKADIVRKLTEFQQAFLGLYPAYLLNGYEEKLMEAFSNYYYTDCLNYDSGLGTVGALEFSLKRGLNWHDPDQLMFAIRNQKFKGCSGDIQLGFNDNNRKDSMLSLYQVLYDIDPYRFIKVLDISVINSPSFTIYNEVIWYDGTTNVPKYGRYTYDGCPFPSEKKHDDPDSQLMTAYIMLGFFFATAGFSLLIYWRYFSKLVVSDTPQPILMSTQDMLIYLSSLIEPFQYLVVAPCQDLLNIFTNQMLDKAVWNQIDFSDGTFWLFINTLFAAFVIWVIVLGYVSACKVSRHLFDLHMVLMLLLRPFNFSFLYGFFTTYSCNKGEDEAGSLQAFMDVDCHVQCWEGLHLSYSVGVAVVVMTYLALSILTLTSLSFILEGHQFISAPGFLLSRIVLQVALIGLYKAKLALGSKTHAGLYIVLLGLHWLNLKNSINVPTLNLWHKSVHLCVLYLALLAILHEEVYSNPSLWTFLFILGIAVGVTATKYRANRLPRLLVALPKVDKSSLFGFAFRKNSEEVTLPSIQKAWSRQTIPTSQSLFLQ
mmetsp:Transcript_6580/g.11566  ORF Transcript_6580/g.11566 Transcript_6580/m.11566 type:complete len:650 (+) Transcript_6580:1195-3144(+)